MSNTFIPFPFFFSKLILSPLLPEVQNFNIQNVFLIIIRSTFIYNNTTKIL